MAQPTPQTENTDAEPPTQSQTPTHTAHPSQSQVQPTILPSASTTTANPKPFLASIRTLSFSTLPRRPRASSSDSQHLCRPPTPYRTHTSSPRDLSPEHERADPIAAAGASTRERLSPMRKKTRSPSPYPERRASEEDEDDDESKDENTKDEVDDKEEADDGVGNKGEETDSNPDMNVWKCMYCGEGLVRTGLRPSGFQCVKCRVP
ncbi:hypothetical protein P280DRAFT_514737 [Massarina eburnea CBS 473.64]|uniref:Uncharacterized protein n=1 Tax=Massarina eburnea CBS 473.64 TaxID=1395130 RepID=A0A6A6SC45_9PLEO|nr:hypothetical protein P280DRAFT_514737 [Massarina eburnea CBS 473.64]